MSSAVVQIDDDSCVAEVRRLAILSAREEGMSETLIGASGIVATEITTNVRKHARVGEVQISTLSSHGSRGVEVLAVDRGPGMQDADGCLADGYSTTGTAGNGLGAVSRLATEFDLYSQPGKGTVIVARIRDDDGDGSANGWRFGAVCAAIRGEKASGDTWAVCHNGTSLDVMVADGLGHGPFAADAAAAAASAFRRVSSSPPAHIVETLHRSLQGTRGAAVAVASLSKGGRILYAGLGNITGVLLGPRNPQFMISHNGTAGHSARRIQEFAYTLAPTGFLIMHSDGLTSNWNLKDYSGLAERHPSVIAGVLYRDASRGRDDVCVVVVKDAAG